LNSYSASSDLNDDYNASNKKRRAITMVFSILLKNNLTVNSNFDETLAGKY
jgi:hypothetical protein